jgi:acyl-CoA dehydrogenase
MYVTDFPHVKQMFTDAYTRLVAMKLFALRASDYQRVASPEDRRYLLYNPMVKMKVTTQGEEVINLLWDVIAAKGFEKDMYFEMAARDIRALPKLEGTVHVNIALIVKFMANYFLQPGRVSRRSTAGRAGPRRLSLPPGAGRGLGQIRFHDYKPILARYGPAQRARSFREQIEAFKMLLATATPDEAAAARRGLSAGPGRDLYRGGLWPAHPGSGRHLRRGRRPARPDL